MQMKPSFSPPLAASPGSGCGKGLFFGSQRKQAVADRPSRLPGPLLRWLLLLLLLPLALSGETIRVASYNVLNYLEMDRLAEGEWRPAYPKPESEKSALRRVILEARPDVLAIQEIGGPGYLRELQRDLKADGWAMPYRTITTGDADRRLAVLSRIPFVRSQTHDDLTFAYFGGRGSVRRGLLEVEFESEGGRPWHLFVVHLKSWFTERRDDRNAHRYRLGEAEAIRNYLVERFRGVKQKRYLVTGDFNDTRLSAPLRRLYSRGDYEITRELPALDSRGERWTYYYEREDIYRRVDFFLLSPELFEEAAGNSAHIVDTLPWARQASDHRLIYLDLDLK